MKIRTGSREMTIGIGLCGMKEEEMKIGNGLCGMEKVGSKVLTCVSK